MATLATLTNRLFDSSSVADASVTRDLGNEALRQLPNEDVFFFVKSINNGNVVREADPEASATCWRSILGTFVAACMLTGMLLPGLYTVFAGYQIESLRAKQEGLKNEQANLDLEIAKMLSPSRMETLARKHEMVPPAADHVIYLNPKADQTESANLR